MAIAAEKNGSGISRLQLEHHIKEHYQPYAMKLREIKARMTKAEKCYVDSMYCSFRSLKKEFLYSTNSVRLHQYYFGNIGLATEKTSLIISILIRDFGSLEEWLDEFTALAMCSRGWLVLGYDLTENKVQHYITDSHAEGVWTVLPLLVMDVYEHAYCGQFQTKKDYIKAFLNSADWLAVDRRLQAALKMSEYSSEIF